MNFLNSKIKSHPFYVEKRLRPAQKEPARKIPASGHRSKQQEILTPDGQPSGYGCIDMQRKKDVLTTGQVAQICNVAPRTVTKWFDSGQLKGYRIPGSRDRRIPTSELIRFMKTHNMPVETLASSELRLLIISSNNSTTEPLVKNLAAKGGYEIQLACNSFDAGIIAQKMIPHLIMIDLMAGEIQADRICSYIRTNKDLCSAKIIALAPSLSGRAIEALIQKGYDAVITDTSDISQVVKTIHHVTSVLS